MNYLAHLFLAGDSADAKLGALLGDFVKGDASGLYCAETVFEIARHRRIDEFTDNHPLTKQAKQFFPVEQRRYAGILLDVYYDHLLARQWKQYSETDLDVYVQTIYDALIKNQDKLPQKLQNMIPVMIEQNWLASYQFEPGFEAAIERISKRLRNGKSLRAGIEVVKSHADELSALFKIFFDELRTFASGWEKN